MTTCECLEIELIVNSANREFTHDKCSPHLFIEEDRLDAVTWNILWLEVAEELEEQLPFLRHGLAWLYLCQILLVVPVHIGE